MKKVLLFIGAVIARKGVDVLIDSFLDLSRNFNDLYLVLVGPKSKGDSKNINEAFVEELEEKIKENDLGERVYWEGIIRDQEVMVDYYRAADIFVFPTRNEGLPNVLIEASAAELPVVATLLPGITDEVIEDGVSGYLVEKEQTDQFVEAIDSLLKDKDKRVAMGKAARKIVLDKFGFESYCQKLKKFYLDIYN